MQPFAKAAEISFTIQGAIDFISICMKINWQSCNFLLEIVSVTVDYLLLYFIVKLTNRVCLKSLHPICQNSTFLMQMNKYTLYFAKFPCQDLNSIFWQHPAACKCDVIWQPTRPISYYRKETVTYQFNYQLLWQLINKPTHQEGASLPLTGWTYLL